MIVLSVGMPRAGSVWHYNLVRDLMETTGCADAYDIRKRYRLQKILTEVNCNIGVLSASRLGLVMLPGLLNTFVIKAHTGPTIASRLLLTLGLMRVAYIYRDPRDAMSSAFDFGQQALAKGRPNAFSYLSDFEKSVDFMMKYVLIWERWMKEKNVLITRYEDLLTNYDAESAKLVEYLKVNRSSPEVRAVIEKYRPAAAEGQQGRIGRFREVYNKEQKTILKEKLSLYLTRMGYDE